MATTQKDHINIWRMHPVLPDFHPVIKISCAACGKILIADLQGIDDIT